MADSADTTAAWRRAPLAMFGATVAGIGHLPGGPGTYAAALATPVFVAASALPLTLRLIAFAALLLLSIPICDRAGRALMEHDSRRIVLDEVVGVATTLIAFSALGWAEAAVGLIAFRIFDILKPPPARHLDRHYEGGWAVVADDVVAGLWALPVVALVRLVFA